MKVGDYVRTKEGYLCKILEIHDEYDDEYLDWNDIGSARIRKSHIVKSSPSIIDLIEVGDYVNGEKVCYLKGDIEKSEVAYEEDVLYTEYNDEYGEWYGYAEDEIESIVTREQFKSMEYKL